MKQEVDKAESTCGSPPTAEVDELLEPLNLEGFNMLAYTLPVVPDGTVLPRMTSRSAPSLVSKQAHEINSANFAGAFTINPLNL